MTKKYLPSCGSAVVLFMNRFCDVCARDAGYRAGTGDSCPIAAATLAYKVDDPRYPVEWQYGAGGKPTCTAFEKE